MNRDRWIAGGAAIGSLLVLGVVISAPMLASAAPAATPAPAPAAGGKLQAYAESLPETVAKIKMLPIPGGAVKVGTKVVTVKPFYIAQTETPWEVYDAFIRSGPPSPAYDQTEFPADVVARPSKSYILPDLGWGHDGYPVINVSSTSVTMFVRWLAKTTGKKYRLPTEAEWQLACQGGPAPLKVDKPTLEKQAWYAGNSQGLTHPVAKKAPNKYGLYDMLGNVGEWCTEADGKFVLCGGTFLDAPAGVTATMRRHFSPKWQETDPQLPKSRWWLSDGKFIGFRVVCEP